MAKEKTKNDDGIKSIVAAALAALLGGGASVYGGSGYSAGSAGIPGIPSSGSIMGMGGGVGGSPLASMLGGVSGSGSSASSASAGIPSSAPGGAPAVPAGGGEDAVKASMGNSVGSFVPFLVPVSTGASLTHNLVGKETPREGAHEQTVAEHAAHMRELVDEFYRDHPLPAGLAGPALAAARNEQARMAIDYAVREEPNRNFGYISQAMDGVKADSRPRTVNGRTFNASSSWVGAVKRTSPNEVQVYLGPSSNNSSGWYTYGGTAKQVEDFLTGDSLGREIGAIRKGGGTTLKKLWKDFSLERKI